jgi:hypothetical protein
MRKLSLINLSKNELTKDEAQKIKAGLTCTCQCICYCECPPRELVAIQAEDRAPVRNADTQIYVA